jgi:hypothetical protein
LCVKVYERKTISKLDKILTSKVTGIPIMIGLLGIILWITIIGANYPSLLLSKFLFMISDKLLHLPLNNLFIKISDDEYLFIIIYTDYFWGKLNTIGNLFYNELGNKIIFDAESNHIYFMSDQIIEKVKIIDEYSIDEKQIILNNYTFSKYDVILCIVLILNFFGIFMLLGSIYKEKIINQLPKNIKQIKNMNK